MTTVPFSMRLDENLKDSLANEARRQDRPASYLASRAIAQFLERQQIERELLADRMKEAEAGVFISQERMSEWVDSWFSDDEKPMPEPDIFPS